MSLFLCYAAIIGVLGGLVAGLDVDESKFGTDQRHLALVRLMAYAMLTVWAIALLVLR